MRVTELNRQQLTLLKGDILTMKMVREGSFDPERIPLADKIISDTMVYEIYADTDFYEKTGA